MKQNLLILFGFTFLFSATFRAQSTDESSTPKAGVVENEILIQLTNASGVKRLLLDAPVEYQLTLVKELSSHMNIWLFQFDQSTVNYKTVENWLNSKPEVLAFNQNHYVELRSTLPGDPSFTQQWHHNNTGQNGGTADADIDSDLAWDITTGGTTASNDGIVLCLIESGNLDHQDLTGNRWFNAAEIPNNSIDDDNNGYVDDYDGWNPVQGNDNYGTGAHGTNCLGMMGAKGDNGLNVVGANWDVKLMVVGGYSISTEADAVEAYSYPLAMRKKWNATNGVQGAFVVATSSSWGIDAEDPAGHPIWCAVYDTLGHHGIISVGATTNSNLNVDTAGDMPTACGSPYMLGVGRTDNNDNTAGGYGVNTIEFGAPGINVVTTANTNTITTTTGTSFSCPLTAGVIGLAYSIPCPNFMTLVKADPQAGADMVLQALYDGVDQKAQLATKFIYGGRLNSFNTLNELMATTCSGTICLAPSSVNIATPTPTTAQIDFTAYGSATGTNFYWRPIGTTIYTEVLNATSPVSLTNLDSCSTYEYYFTSDCNGDLSNPTTVSSFTTIGCGNCVDLPYCATGATVSTDEWIDGFVINSFTNNSGNSNGYEDFGSIGNIVLQTTVPVGFGIVVGWAQQHYDEYSRIWVDMNQNGTFETSEIVFDQGAANQLNQTGTFTIPATATLGKTKLRVQMAYQGPGQNSLPGVCGSFTYGEVEDYCITLEAAPTSGVGLEELEDGAVILYPNPAIDELTITISTASIQQLEVFDHLGKSLLTKKVNVGDNKINVSRLAVGSYICKLSDENGMILKSMKLQKIK